jgi:hypothetical protein
MQEYDNAKLSLLGRLIMTGWEMNTVQKVQRYKMDKEDKDAKGTTEIKRGCRNCCNTKDREDTRKRRMAKGQTNNGDKKGKEREGGMR